MRVQFHTASPRETLILGEKIGSRLPQGSVVGLDGPLAAGKTWIAKGIVQGIGSHDPSLVKSPAYNLIHEYHLECPAWHVFHIDFYRLDELSLPDTLLFSEILDRPDAICLVEWAGKFLGDLVPSYLSIALSRPGTPGHRDVTIEVMGSSAEYANLLCHLSNHGDALS